MRSLGVFVALWVFLGVAFIIGSRKSPSPLPGTAHERIDQRIPHIGSVQVLNGCGIDGAAGAVADFLRQQGFDVKDIDNAQGWDGTTPAWHYPFTIVVSQSADISNAQAVGRALSTTHVILRRVENSIHDVVVYVGPDWEERVQ